MPYKSNKQRRYMHAVLPHIAKKWDEEEKKSIEQRIMKATSKNKK